MENANAITENMDFDASQLASVSYICIGTWQNTPFLLYNTHCNLMLYCTNYDFLC